MQIRFSELASAGIVNCFPDESRQNTCYVHLKYFLSRDHAEYSVRCDAFDDLELFLYKFGKYRVLWVLAVWSG